MKLAWVWTCAFAVFASAQDPESLFRPSALHALANGIGSRVAWQKELARLDTAHSSAVVSAVVVENAGRTLRGIRVDFARAGEPKGSAHIDESSFDLYKRALASIENGVARRQGPASFIGACEFREATGNVPLRVDHYFDHYSDGLRIAAAGLYPEFRFPGQRAATLLRAIETAEAELKNR